MFKSVLTQDILESILHTAIPQLKSIAPSELAHKQSPDKWSKQEILGHLIDSAIHNNRRIKQFLQQEHLVFDGYDQDKEVAINEYQNRPLPDIIDLFNGMNRQIIQSIKAIPTDRLKHLYDQHNFHRLGIENVSESDPGTITHLIHSYINHLEHHLSQLIEAYEKKLAVS